MLDRHATEYREETMKAFSVRQPFAELIASGEKTIEVRPLRTHYRGALLVCSGVAWHASGAARWGRIGLRGVMVCVVDLHDCRPFTLDDAGPAKSVNSESALAASSWAWCLRSVRRVTPKPVRGALGFFFVPDGNIEFV
jgi:ASCH domain-containing protein